MTPRYALTHAFNVLSSACSNGQAHLAASHNAGSKGSSSHVYLVYLISCISCIVLLPVVVWPLLITQTVRYSQIY